MSGIDTIQSFITRTLASYAAIENLTLTGTAHIDGTGNGLVNTITGNSGNILNAGLQSFTLIGGSGSDTFVFDTALSATNKDTISDYNVAADMVRLENAIFTALAVGNLSAAAFAKNTTGDATDRNIYETDTGRLYYDANGAAGIHFAT